MKNIKTKSVSSATAKLNFKWFEFLISKQSLRLALFFLLLHVNHLSFSQNVDSTKLINTFGSMVTVTNNGISFIPTFSLGKPAAIFDLSVGRRLTFEPQFRFSLEGKPWSFLFWWRYKLVKTDRFRINIGAHPALSFKTSTFLIDGIAKDYITAQRFVAGEVVPYYLLTKNISVGMYYLYSRGLESDATQHTHFLTLNLNFANINLSHQFYARFTPQVYYLKMDAQDGFYFTSALTLGNKKLPLSISGQFNKIIQTQITASKNFVWNVSLVYSFNKKYVER